MRITICGSMTFRVGMKQTAELLSELGHEVKYPDLNEDHNYEGKTPAERAADKNYFIRAHRRKIEWADAILVYNPRKNGLDGYIGGNTLLEMGMAEALCKDIFVFWNVSEELSYIGEVNGMLPVFLDADLYGIERHFAGLPEVRVASQSELKLFAVRQACRNLGLSVHTSGFNVSSGIEAQPFSLEATRHGAENRLDNLMQLSQVRSPLLYAAIESGNEHFLEDHDYFGCAVCVLSDSEGSRVLSVTADLEMPRELTDMVPSQYPDMGVLMMEHFGQPTKDPYAFVSAGRTNREKLMIETVNHALVQLPLESLPLLAI